MPKGLDLVLDPELLAALPSIGRADDLVLVDGKLQPPRQVGRCSGSMTSPRPTRPAR